MWRRLVVAFLLALLGVPLGCAPTVVSDGSPGWSKTVRESSLLEYQEGEGEAPEELFASDIPLVFTLEADFKQLRKDRSQESEERPARMTVKEGPGREVSFPIQLRTRGNFRLKSHICPFPPLRLNLPTDSVSGTLLEGQDKLKLVTHCMDRDSYELNALEEYLTYRIYNLLTDVGFRVQLGIKGIFRHPTLEARASRGRALKYSGLVVPRPGV